MQRTILLAIVLLGLAATPSWTQDPVASPPVSPPAPPVAEPMGPKEAVNPGSIATEAAKLIVQLEDERVKLLQNLGDKHPMIEELDARLAQARKTVVAGQPAAPGSLDFSVMLKQYEAVVEEVQLLEEKLARMEEHTHAYRDSDMMETRLALKQAEAKLAVVERQIAAPNNQFKASLMRAMLTSLSQWQRTSGTDKSQVAVIEAQIPDILARTDVSLEAAQKATLELVEKLDNEAIALTEKAINKENKLMAQREASKGSDGLREVTDITELSRLKRRLAALKRAQSSHRFLSEPLPVSAKPPTQSNSSLTNSPATPRTVEEAAIPFMRACVLEVKVERDTLSKQLGPKHARVAALDSYIAEVEAKIQEIETASRAERAKSVSELREVIAGMTPEWYANWRAQRDQLAKDDPTNPQIREWDISLPAAIVTQRQYQGMIEAFDSGQDSPVEALTRTLMERVYAPTDLPQQLAQLRKDYDAAEGEAQRLAGQLRRPGSTASKEELRQTVERAFKLRQSLLRAELGEMLDRLAKTQHSIDLRDRITDQIVTRRVEELLNPQLEWDESKPGTRPETPSASLKGTAPTQPQEWATKLQGHWRLMQHTYEQVDTSDGKKPQPGDVKRENWNPETYYRKQTTHWKAMFDESRMSICKEDGSDPMTFELTFRKAGPPQQVDLTMEHSPADLAELNQMDEEDRSSNVIPTFKGILEETPDGFRICLDMGRTQTRPFLFVLGPDTSLWEYRRESADNQIMNRQVERDESKSGTQPDTPAASPKESAPSQSQEWTTKLQGRWQLTQHAYIPVDTSNGKKPQPGDIKRENWNPETYYRIKKIPLKAILDGNRLSACREDGSNPATFELTFRNAGPPQQVDLTMELSQADLAEIKEKDEELRNSTVIPLFKGIIEETPNGFRMCTDPFGTGHRPFLFVAGPDSVLWEFQREAVAPTATAQERDAAEETLPPAEAKAAEKKASPSDTGTAKAGQLNAEQLTLLFLAILERRPTDREKDAWFISIQNGQSVTDVISTLLANNQVFNRVGRDKAEYIKYLHRLLMDRSPTAEELTYWTRRYDELQGIRSEVAREFLGSVSVDDTASEFLARLAAAPQPLKPVAKEPAAPASKQKPKGTTRKALVAIQDIIPGRLLTDKNVVFEEVPLSVLSSVGDDFIQTQEEYEQEAPERWGGELLIRKPKLREKGTSMPRI
ncbi:MAG: hypothetical protein U0929_11375 [Planctomycetaceae bacterium]